MLTLPSPAWSRLPLASMRFAPDLQNSPSKILKVLKMHSKVVFG